MNGRTNAILTIIANSLIEAGYLYLDGSGEVVGHVREAIERIYRDLYNGCTKIEAMKELRRIVGKKEYVDLPHCFDHSTSLATRMLEKVSDRVETVDSIRLRDAKMIVDTLSMYV